MVKTPLYPDYQIVKSLLEILEGISVLEFKDAWNTIWSLRGTPQNTVDWKNPSDWITERLTGTDQEIALKIWNESKQTVNPRYTRGSQFFMNTYKLLEEVNGIYQLTQKGEKFVSSRESQTIREIDKKEGLFQLLFQLSILEKGKRSDLIEDWTKYLDVNSNVRKDSTIKDYLRRRLVNLLGRGYVKRKSNAYSITDKGKKYLKSSFEDDDKSNLNQLFDLEIQIENFKSLQRKTLKEFLEKTDPYQFEHIVKDLLISMKYEDVEVTKASNDKGVDVVGVSQNGITTVKEVIQVKRNTKGNVSRTILDKLRGSLHRFDAFQGTVITLSDFAKGAKDAAFEKGAAPITLINGEKLIDLLIQYEIGINKQNFQYYTVDENYFDNDEEENLE